MTLDTDTSARELLPGIRITGPMRPGYQEALSAPALELLADLQRTFGGRREELLAQRHELQRRLLAGATLDFLAETAEVRAADWGVALVAPGLDDRRVEITGPTDRKMAINALNSGAQVWMADFEDANAPHWDNMVQGQLNLRDALDRTIDFTDPGGKAYALGDKIATIVVRPRGWHLTEKHLLIDGRPISAGLFDCGLYLFHCARRQLDAGRGPYLYLPKLESHLEARLWNDVFVHAQEAIGLPRGTIRATVLIETLPAAFEMEEILHELREHSSGLNAGRWDYLFSTIKKLRDHGADYILPDRNAVTMEAPFMRAYTQLLVRTCHRRGAHAIGGMAAFIPSRRDPEVNARALAKVREDKEREARDGFDGSWVAHPDLVPMCREVFDGVLAGRPNQLDRRRDDVDVAAGDLLAVGATPGQATEEGLRNDVSVALQYLDAWLRGSGAVAIFNLMEDVATAEIARAQVWQWVRHGVTLADGRPVTHELVKRIADEEMAAIAAARGGDADPDGLRSARALFDEVALAEDFAEFLTVPGYERIP